MRPLVRKLVTAEHVHGKTGLDGPDLPEPSMPLQAGHAVDFIVETLLSEEPGSVTLCTLGPLTNIALALIRAPEIASRVHEIVLMGGGFFEGGNITPAAEFNIYVDPHAAEAVFDSGIPLVMMPLDVTHKALTTRARVEAFQARGTRVCDAVADLSTSSNASTRRNTAPTARRCTIRASSPIFSSRNSSAAARAMSRSRPVRNSPWA